ERPGELSTEPTGLEAVGGEVRRVDEMDPQLAKRTGALSRDRLFSDLRRYFLPPFDAKGL
ncbi:MAG TPA: hypothetical protein VLA62_11630, partial [Solirubrobacterales bacterium]|nr:hypothetical protein [Solirubrobacterales bacterium]